MRIDNESPAYDSRRFTPLGFERRLSAACPAAEISVSSHGNVLIAVGFLMGLAQEEFDLHELEHQDPRFPLLVSAVVRQAAHAGPGT
jgi:hypothetical protein